MEDLTLKERLGVKLTNKLDDLSKLTLGSKEHGQASKDIVELAKVYYQSVDGDSNYEVSCRKIEAESAAKEAELELKQQQLALELRKVELDERKLELETAEKQKESKKSIIMSIIDTGLKLGGLAIQIAIPLIAWKKYTALFAAGLEFEENGTFTSSMVKDLKGKIRPDKM